MPTFQFQTMFRLLLCSLGLLLAFSASAETNASELEQLKSHREGRIREFLNSAALSSNRSFQAEVSRHFRFSAARPVSFRISLNEENQATLECRHDGQLDRPGKWKQESMQSNYICYTKLGIETETRGHRGTTTAFAYFSSNADGSVLRFMIVEKSPDECLWLHCTD